MYIEQHGIGLVGTYEIELENFNIDELEFQIIEINGNVLLQSFKYKDKPLKFKKNDILLTFQNGFEINQKISQ